MSKLLEAVIFDLDQTIVDSSSLESHRRNRDWNEVYKGIPSLNPYDGICPLISRLRKGGIKVAVVTSSPSSYFKKVAAHCGVTCDVAVCYHDTQKRKPHPDPMLLALEKLSLPNGDSTVAVGDHPNDIISANAAGIFSIAAAWGCADEATLIKVQPDLVAYSVAELESYFAKSFKI